MILQYEPWLTFCIAVFLLHASVTLALPTADISDTRTNSGTINITDIALLTNVVLGHAQKFTSDLNSSTEFDGSGDGNVSTNASNTARTIDKRWGPYAFRGTLEESTDEEDEVVTPLAHIITSLFERGPPGWPLPDRAEFTDYVLMRRSHLTTTTQSPSGGGVASTRLVNGISYLISAANGIQAKALQGRLSYNPGGGLSLTADLQITSPRTNDDHFYYRQQFLTAAYFFVDPLPKQAVNEVLNQLGRYCRQRGSVRFDDGDSPLFQNAGVKLFFTFSQDRFGPRFSLTYSDLLAIISELARRVEQRYQFAWPGMSAIIAPSDTSAQTGIVLTLAPQDVLPPTLPSPPPISGLSSAAFNTTMNVVSNAPEALADY